jgi:hypothetical protein
MSKSSTWDEVVFKSNLGDLRTKVHEWRMPIWNPLCQGTDFKEIVVDHVDLGKEMRWGFFKVHKGNRSKWLEVDPAVRLKWQSSYAINSYTFAMRIIFDLFKSDHLKIISVTL